MEETKNKLGAKELEARSKIGRHIVYWALAAVTLLGLVAMLTGANNEKNFPLVKDVLSMLLPVIGAWVGTVLAFYFSRENYLAATENNAALLGLTLEQRLQAIPAKSAMLPMSQVDAVRTDETDDNIKLKDHLLEAEPIKSGRNRVPILSTNGIVRYILHRSMVDKFISGKAMVPGTNVALLTLKDLVDAGDYKEWIASFGCVRPDDPLSVVKSKMGSNPKCQDVIVTDDGIADKPALGWVTNVIVLEKSRM